MQFILQNIPKVTIGNEYSLKIPSGKQLVINWFAGIEIVINSVSYNETTPIYRICGNTETLTNIPIKYEDENVLIVEGIFINKKNKTYLDYLP
jgi:hypothetical protein